TTRLASSTAAAMAAVVTSPTPQARPMAATTQRLAAVVRLRTVPPRWMMTPAPRKPMPTTTYEATRVTSAWSTVVVRSRSNSSNPRVEITPNSEAPRATAMCVRRPAAWSLASRSRPTAPPSSAAASRRTPASPSSEKVVSSIAARAAATSTPPVSSLRRGRAAGGRSGPHVEDELLVLVGEHVAEAADLARDHDVEVEDPVVVGPAVEQADHLPVLRRVLAGDEAHGERRAPGHRGAVDVEPLERDDVEQHPVGAVGERDELADGHGHTAQVPAVSVSESCRRARLARRRRDTCTWLTPTSSAMCDWVSPCM